MAHTTKIKKYATVSAVITRLDGTIEDLGVIASTKKKSILGRLFKWLMSLK